MTDPIPPEWLNKEFIQEKLREGMKNEDIVVTDCTLSPAVGVGDNYTSCMFRAKLELKNGDETRKKSLVIKVESPNPSMANFTRNTGLFLKEAKMMGEYLPQLLELERQLGEFPSLCAKCYYYQRQPTEVLILEDLCETGYQVGNRFQGLDLDECVMVLNSLARIHATSILLFEKKPEMKEFLLDGFWQRGHQEKTFRLYTDAFSMLAEKLEEWSETEYLEKVLKLKDDFVETIYSQTDRDDSQVNVINHGDLWTNNMMFKYSENPKKAIGFKFVDLQLSYYSSPVSDLVYFIFSSCQNDIKINKLDYMLEVYHKKFSSLCEDLGIEINFTLEDLKSELKKKLTFALAVSISIFPLTCASREDALKPDAENEKSGLQGSNMYNNQRFRDGILDILAYLDENGLFD